jgi:hypothetical protein
MTEKQISILIDETLKRKFDKWCIDNGTNKTEFFLKKITEAVGID